MFNPFSYVSKLIDWFSEGISTKAKVILMVLMLGFMLMLGFIGYKINDYFEHDPTACGLCHVHDEANKEWAKSVHAGLNCHECHHSTKKDQVVQMYRFAVLGQKTVSPRHGEVIVPWKLCFSCHWEENKKFPNAPNISHSRYHAKHAFIEKIECTKCHGYRTHKFTLEERYCLTCHKGKEVHGAGMDKLPCLNCHTDRTSDLKPGRKKCLFCHGGEDIRKELIAGGTMDVKHFLPSQETIKKAKKIVVSEEAPMQFPCHECHKPHTKVKPDSNDCIRCHTTEPKVGKHEMHLLMNMKCLDCHKPHLWKITEEQAKKDCVKCHDYKAPKDFVGL